MSGITVTPAAAVPTASISTLRLLLLLLLLQSYCCGALFRHRFYK